MRGDFLDIARAHWARWPAMEPQDFAKLAYQSEFGPAHMAESPDRVLAALLAERKEAGTASLAPEPIGNGLCRFHITQALSPLSDLPLLARMFSLTASLRRDRGTMEGLLEKLKRLGALNIPGWKEYLTAYRVRGCPPVHHSEAFRRAYGPHYRVVGLDYAGFFPALRALDRFSREHDAARLRLSHGGEPRDGGPPREKGPRPCLIAVDGRCGSGKTSLAAAAELLIPGRKHVIHMDDHYLPWERRAEKWMDIPAGNMDLESVRARILAPAREGRPLADPSILQAAAEKTADLDDAELILVEGTYSQHPLLAPYYDYKIFLTCGREEQTRRLQKREGDYYPTFDRIWRTLEERYFAACGTEAAADLTVDTTVFFD